MSILPIGEPTEMHPESGPPPAVDAWDRGWPQNTDELEALVETYLDRLVRYAFRRVGSIQDAEDVVQEVFVRALAEQSRQRKRVAVGPYLYRSVANGCIDLLRKRKRSGVSGGAGKEETPSGGESPSDIALAVEEMRRAEELLSRLPDTQAEVIRLRVFDELRLAEIAEVVGCSVNTVCSRLRYGLQRLRVLVAEKREVRP